MSEEEQDVHASNIGGISSYEVMRDKFTGGDQKYLRCDQYRDPTKLAARADLHAKYGTANVRWFPWVAGQIDWPFYGDILEVGCGPGWMWEEAASQLPSELRLTLTDLSAGMVDVALDRASTVFETVQGCEVDAQRLPFKPESFDVIVANHMLYHVPEPSRAVTEFARVLRPHGVLVAGTVGEGNLRELWQIRSECVRERARSSNCARFWRNHGFTDPSEVVLSRRVAQL